MACFISASFLFTNAFNAFFENHYEKNIWYGIHSEVLLRLVNWKHAPPSLRSSWTIVVYMHIVSKYIGFSSVKNKDNVPISNNKIHFIKGKCILRRNRSPDFLENGYT